MIAGQPVSVGRSYLKIRFVLESLDARITVGPSGVSLSLAVPEGAMSAVFSRPWSAGAFASNGSGYGIEIGVTEH